MPVGEGLIPLNKRSPEERRAIQSKGGRTKTPKSQLSKRLNIMKTRGQTISMEKSMMIDALRNGDINDALLQAVTQLVNISDEVDPKEWDAVVARLIQMSPSKNINLNLSSHQDVTRTVFDVIKRRKSWRSESLLDELEKAL